MPLTLDHVFVCTAAGAPEAEVLRAAGFAEGPANVHPGQGTACRRFFFENAYLELVWVQDETEARAPETAPTRLWERWRGRGDGLTCPFGVGLCVPDGAAAPFPTWPYQPRYLPPGMAMPVATNGDALHEPMLFLLPPRRRPDPTAAPAEAARTPPRDHATGVRAVTRVALAGPPVPAGEALAAVVASGIIERHVGDRPLLVLGVDGEATGQALDLRPTLPLVLRW